MCKIHPFGQHAVEYTIQLSADKSRVEKTHPSTTDTVDIVFTIIREIIILRKTSVSNRLYT